MHLVKSLLKFRLGDPTLGKGFPQGRCRGIAVRVRGSLSGIRMRHTARIVPDLRDRHSRARIGA